ncbi:MAG TPA: mycofactocin precursor MftA [Acidimicrobiales bacterium]|nr:mycofactocin precursor MftA [Acidimicrobiales bacterium]
MRDSREHPYGGAAITTAITTASTTASRDACGVDESVSEDEELVLAEVLVEDVSIDGMCGVY